MKPCDPNCDGSDAEHPDFSDDEEEKRYYDKLYKQRKYGTKNMVQNWHKNLGSGARQSSKRICTLSKYFISRKIAMIDCNTYKKRY